MVPNADQVAIKMLLRKKRMLPSPNAALTPPVCRLRAAANWGLPKAIGMSGSPFIVK